MKYMIIDIGSNTVKYEIFEASEGSSSVKCGGKSRTLGFISHIINGRPSDEIMERMCETLNEYILDAKEAECDGYFAYATASFRSCEDPMLPIRIIKEKIGLDVRLLTGEEEAAFSLRGVLSGYKDERDGVMVDMGGASTEINFFRERESVYLVSLPFGALKMKNTFAPRKINTDDIDMYCTRKELEAIAGKTGEILDEKLLSDIKCDKIYLVGGSAKAVGRIVKKDRDFDGEMTLDELKAIYEKFAKMNKKKDKILRDVMPDRYLLILPAVSAFIVICEKLAVKTIIISKSGIRNGYFDAAVCGEIR